MTRHKNVYKTLIILTTLITLLTGCARTVTEDKTPLLNVEISITFRGTIDPLNFNYFIILSSLQTPALPTVPNAGPFPYFPTPGRTFNESNQEFINNSGANFYYQNFFSKWTDYIVITQQNTTNQAILYKSDSPSFNANETNLLNHIPDPNFQNTLTISGSTLILTFQLQDLSQDPSSWFFTFATSHKTDTTQTGFIHDHLKETTPQFTKNAQFDSNQTNDAQNPNISAGMDILNWRVRVF